MASVSRKPIVNSKLKSDLREMRSALWFRPAMFCVLAIFFVILVVSLEPFVDTPPLKVIESDSLADILRFVASGMLTVTTVTLSVLMLVLSLAAGQASPRSVPELMADRITQNALSMFLGTLVFALTAQALLELGAVKGFGIATLFLSALLLVASAITCLVIWIHHVADSLKLNRIIERIYRQAQSVFDTYFSNTWEVGHADLHQLDSAGATCRIGPDRVGYVQLVDVEELDLCASEHVLSLNLLVREGDFVHPALTVMEVQSNNALDDDLKQRLQGLVVIGTERSSEGDPVLGVELLTEVACRALSPSMNDPQSAISCINYLDALLTQAGSVSPPHYPPRHSRTGRVNLIPVSFQDMLKRAVRPIVREGAAHAEVICAVVDVLEKLTELAAVEYLVDIQKEAEAAADYGNRRLLLERDKDAVASQIANLKAKVRDRLA